VTSEYAITGQEGINPLICVWNHSSMNTFFIVRNEMVLGVQLVSFCEEGNDFVAAEVGGRNFVEVYKFDKVQKLREKRGIAFEGNKGIFECNFFSAGSSILIVKVRIIV
jgi:hypothetical protein